MKRAKNNNKLTQKEINKFEKLLLSKRNELLGNINCMEDGTLRKNQTDLSKLPVHMADLGTDNYDQEFTLGLVGSEMKLLREINDALQRIADGTYGICEGDKSQIAKARLTAIPWAKHCVKCAGLLEKGITLSNKNKDYDDYNYGDIQDEASDDNYY